MPSRMTRPQVLMVVLGFTLGLAMLAPPASAGTCKTLFAGQKCPEDIARDNERANTKAINRYNPQPGAVDEPGHRYKQQGIDGTLKDHGIVVHQDGSAPVTLNDNGSMAAADPNAPTVPTAADVAQQQATQFGTVQNEQLDRYNQMLATRAHLLPTDGTQPLTNQPQLFKTNQLPQNPHAASLQKIATLERDIADLERKTKMTMSPAIKGIYKKSLEQKRAEVATLKAQIK